MMEKSCHHASTSEHGDLVLEDVTDIVELDCKHLPNTLPPKDDLMIPKSSRNGRRLSAKSNSMDSGFSCANGHTNVGYFDHLELKHKSLSEQSVDNSDIKSEHESSLSHDNHVPEISTTIIRAQTVRINISGTIFEVSTSVLKQKHQSRLSQLAYQLTDDPSYRSETNDYFFDRNPAVFADILEYFRSGELHLDQGNCGAIFEKLIQQMSRFLCGVGLPYMALIGFRQIPEIQEMEFWGLQVRDISMCCWAKFESHKATAKMYNELDELFDDGTTHITAPNSDSCMSKIHYYVFHTLENPSFSLLSKVFMATSMIITLASIFAFVAESHTTFQQLRLSNGTFLPAPEPEHPAGSSASCCCSELLDEAHETNHSADSTLNTTHNETDLEHELHSDSHVDSHIALHYLDFFTFGYFLFEITIRFIFSYHKRKFFRSALNVVELVCIAAHFISIMEHSISVDTAEDFHQQDLYLIFVLRSLRIMRIARIFKLFRHMTGFKVLIYTIVVSFNELLLVLSFLFAGVLLFASIIHYAEEDTFPNIPFAIWWALVTMTTVGYGDVTPKSNMGYFIGALSVVAGVLVIAFTVPVVVNNFTIYYALCKSRSVRLKIIENRKSRSRGCLSWLNCQRHCSVENGEQHEAKPQTKRRQSHLSTTAAKPISVAGKDDL